MKHEMVLSSVEDIRVFSDPFRLKILYSFEEGNNLQTVKQIAIKMGEVPAKIHYHVKELERIGVLKMVETREKSGIIEKYYQPTAEVFRVQKSVSTIKEDDDLKSIISDNFFKTIQDEYRLFIKNMRDSDKNHSFNFGVVYLTDEEYSELISMINEFIVTKEKKEGSKPYIHAELLFRKLNEGESEC